jgi:adenylate cyclase
VSEGQGHGAAGPEEAARAVEEMARARLISDDRARRLRRLWRMVPGGSRCKICTSPFGAPFGPLLRFVGKGRWPGNPRYCSGCFRAIYANRGGAEVECTLFFADIRGSTALAETIRPTEFRSLMDRFYRTASEVLVSHEAVVDKFVGDEVVAIFVPAMTGGAPARQAIDAGLSLLRATGNDAGNPWAPIGIGVNTGEAYVGTVGTADHVEFTALGDAVNVTARLASAAGPGELLVTESAAQAAGLIVDETPRRELELRGRTLPTVVFVLRADGQPAR